MKRTVTPRERAHPWFALQGNIADSSELFIFGDDFDAILDILEEEEELDEYFTEAADDVEFDDLVCELCSKNCKSKSGLKRHKTAKHKDQNGADSSEKPMETEQFTFEIYCEIIHKAKAKIVGKKLYPSSIREEINTYQTNPGNGGISEIKNMYGRLVKSGNAEQFYTSFYSAVVSNAVIYFEGLSRDAATLLSTKVADCILASSKEKV